MHAPARAIRITVFVLGLVVGLALMGRDGNPQSRFDELLAAIGAAVMIGAWLWSTRPGPLRNLSAAAAMAHELREIDERLEHFETPALLQKKGETLIATNQPKKAIAPLERAVQLDDGDIHTHYLLGQAYFAARRFNDAWRCFDRVYRADKDQEYLGIRLWAAKTYLELEEPAHAEALADGFLEKEKGHLAGLSLKADALFAQGRAGDAAEVYRQFLEVYQRTAEFDQRRYAAEVKVARKRANG